MAKYEELSQLNHESLTIRAIEIIQYIGGNGAVGRFRPALRTREQLIDFIQRNDPEERE
jgi:hypothetical protein